LILKPSKDHSSKRGKTACTHIYFRGEQKGKAGWRFTQSGKVEEKGCSLHRNIEGAPNRFWGGGNSHLASGMRGGRIIGEMV